MKWVSAGISFIIVFVIVFILGGWFLMPHLPPIPDRLISVYELDYWTDNWAGALLGLILAGLSARSIIKKNTNTNKKSYVRKKLNHLRSHCEEQSDAAI